MNNVTKQTQTRSSSLAQG